MIINTRLAIMRRVALNNLVRGKRRAEPGTAKRRMADIAENPRKTQKSSDNPDNHSQLKDPPECGMVEPGLDPSVVIPLPQRQNTKVQSQPLLLQHN